jgi:limonene-1,2-epoxide hydrolase
MTKTALEIVQIFQQSMGSGTNEWENLFATDIVFKGPVDTVTGKEANIELNKGFFPKVKNYESISHFEQGNFVALEGIFSVATPKGNTIKLEMAEIYEIKDGKIQNIRVYYDAEEFRKEFTPTV